jgi:AcrR family transcriptional regulator
MSKPSQNSIDEPATCRQPKRERGRLRVESLLDAAATVFTERGIEAATMTEIAERAGASIGSLYQFFPNKALLAQALHTRFVTHAVEVFRELEQAAPRHTPTTLADALMGYVHAIQDDRAASLALIDTRNEYDPDRVKTRTVIVAALSHVLRAANPALDAIRANHAARLILYLLRLVVELPYEQNGDAIAEELRGLLRGYLEDIGR